MVVACQGYITESDSVRVWDIPTTKLLERVEACKNLFNRYQQCFLKAKERSQKNPHGHPLEVSEMYVFGKFKNFCIRLDHIRTMVEIIERFSAIKGSCIEGIEPLNNRFQGIVSMVKKKNYNILDPRKHEFDTDFSDFKRQIKEVEVRVHTYIYTYI